MDLIDFQTCADGEFKWPLVYQDHFTKLVQLRPIRAKSAIEVATTSSLLKYFLFSVN